MSPGRQDSAEHCRAGNIRVLVSSQSQSSCSSGTHHFEHRADFVPVLAPSDFEVADMDSDAGLLADFNHFRNSIFQVVALAAHMRDEYSTHLRDRLAQLDQFGGVGKTAGGIDQAGGHTKGAFPDRLSDELLHGADF